MKSLFKNCLFLLAILFLTGCKKEIVQPPSDYNIQDIIKVYGENGPWTQAKLEQAIVGDWQWKKNHCMGFGGITPVPDQYAAYSIRINSDESIELFENGQLVHTATWSLAFSGNSGDFDPPQPVYSFATTPKSNDHPFTYNLGGWMYLGGNVLVFSLVPVDGCDTFLERK